MTIESSISSDGKVLSISVTGRFDATSLDDFRRSYESSDNVQQYQVDLKETIYLDSSGLGMLLVLRDFAGGDKAQISIANCSPVVKKIFSISNFNQLFDIQ